MRSIQGLDLKKWFEADVRRALGPNPTSTSPQPVHVLNGFFHAATTGRRMTRTATDLVASRNGIWQISQEALRAKTEGRLELPTNDEELDALRHALDAMTATDGAVFLQNASFQVAHVGLTSTDTVHFGLGSLAAQLVLHGGHGRRLLAETLARLHEAQPNPHWGVQRALIDESTSATWTVVDDPEPPPRWATEPATQGLATNLASLLVRCLDLSAGTADSLLALQVLANACTWVGLMAYSQVPTLAAQQKVKPLLIETSRPGDYPTVREASVTALTDLHLQFEAWLADALERTLRGYEIESMTDAEARYFLNTTDPYSLSGGAKDARDNITSAFLSYRRDEDVIPSLARALRDLLVSGMGNKHRSWYHAVGRHCGFVGPRRGKAPRLRAEVSLLPTLVLAGMPDERTPAVLMQDWLTNLEERFGLAVGPGSIARGLDPLPAESELEANQRDLSTLLQSVGLARRYSDGVTEVFDPRHLWAAK